MRVRSTVYARFITLLCLAFGFLVVADRGNADSLNVTPALVGFSQIGAGKIELVFACRVGIQLPLNYVPFVHITDRNQATNEGIVMAVDPRLPPNASTWIVGSTVTGFVETVNIPSTLKDGNYEIKFGMYDPYSQDRLILSGTDDGEHRFIVGQLFVSGGGKNITVPGVPRVSPNLDGCYRVHASAGHFLQTGLRAFTIVCGWMVQDRIPAGEQVFVHVVNLHPGPSSDIVAQAGSGITADPATWPVGQKTLSNPVPITLPSDLPDGKYDIRVGLFKNIGGARLQLLGSNEDGTLRYTVGSIVLSNGGQKITFLEP